MKTLLITFLLLFSILSSAQISGKVLNENNDPVEFATLFNINKETSAITNADGVFQLEGELGDSIQIQHLNYNTSEFTVLKLEDDYTLIQKNYDLGEVVVSANYAARLFEKSCGSTYNKLKDKSVSRGYLRNIRIVNNDTTQLIDLDLDIVQRKQKSYNHKHRISPYKVQERVKRDTTDIAKLRLRVLIFPDFGTADWSKFQNYFNFFKIEDSEYIKLYFLNKESFHDSITHIETIIQKSDTSLFAFSMVSRVPARNRKGEILTDKAITFVHLEYGYNNRFSYISEMSQGYIFTDQENGKMSLLQFFKTYDNGATNIERRPDGHKIFDNYLESNKIKNKYDEEFWEKDSYLKSVPYDFNYLLQLRLGEELN